MAYTITQPTNEYLPGENLSWFEMDSDNKAELSFNYKMVLKVIEVSNTFSPGSTGSDVVGTFRVPPRPVTGNAYFSPNAVAKNYVSSQLQFNTGGTVGYTDNGIRKYQIVFGEEYIDGSGNLISTDNEVSNEFYIWDSIIQDEDFPSYAMNDYIVRNQPLYPDGHTLTDGPNERCAIENDNLYALIYPDTYNPSTLGLSYYLDPYYQLWVAGVMSFWVNETPTGGQAQPWVEVNIPTDGITVLSGLNVGEYSMAAYLPPSGSVPHGTGPIVSGDILDILIRTRTLWVNNDILYDLELWGKLPGGVWLRITDFQKIQANGDETFYQIQNLLIPTDFQYIGLVTRRNATLQSVPPTLYQIETYDLTSSYDLNWKYVSASQPYPTGIDYPISQLGKITWINAGTDGIGSTTEDYSIAIYDGNNARLSELISYSSCGDCGGCEKVNITWLNSLGGYDTYEFNCLVEKELDVTRVSGERTLPPNYTVGQRGKLNSSNVANRNKVVATNYTTQENIDWLESLFMSTDAYEVDADGAFLPIVIDTNSYSQFVRQDKLKMVEFGYTIGYTRKSQIN